MYNKFNFQLPEGIDRNGDDWSGIDWGNQDYSAVLITYIDQKGRKKSISGKLVPVYENGKLKYLSFNPS